MCVLHTRRLMGDDQDDSCGAMASVQPWPPVTAQVSCSGVGLTRQRSWWSRWRVRCGLCCRPCVSLCLCGGVSVRRCPCGVSELVMPVRACLCVSVVLTR